ncbi:acyl-CoA thioester hydrolase/BAAT C-terminal domain-containing protein [Bryobacter aggregatus]|uniref:acyl-CoA thioester hydrolase/BAAT C-terminal domain-containing protein n=1 Tax=Bryobacter aggregatus TaxID=360054 RepID=UPI0004E0F63E|nr:acyl-CoA thioester hydrolase/BAAT C-terminal domain-containing protein [Bryobacter aggregatus]
MFNRRDFLLTSIAFPKAPSRKQLLADWIEILGKVEPNAVDRRHFHRKMQARLMEASDAPGYTRQHLELPLEVDFYQPSLLLTPKNIAKGERRPAVIAWTSTSPDWRQPEKNWGAWLASKGFIVLTGWAHIRNYRDGASYKNGVSEKVYERFGRWSGLGRMVWDVRQQAQWLAQQQNIDSKRIGFIGSSLSAKTALYAAAFAPEVAAAVSIDPYVPLYGTTNYHAPWYMDWDRKFDEIRTPEHTVRSLLAGRTGRRHDHDEILALAAPKPLLIIGGNGGADSDKAATTQPLVDQARQSYAKLGKADNLQLRITDSGHVASSPLFDSFWQEFFLQHLARR